MKNPERQDQVRTAVIGGAGFIGAHLVTALLQRGHRVLVYDNLFARGSSRQLPWRQRVEFARADILDTRLLTASLRSFQAQLVYHLAALHYIPYCNRNPGETIRVNVEGTLNVLQALQASPRARGIVFASSAAVYGPSACAHRETDPLAPCDVYGLSKMLAERVVLFYAEKARLRHAIVRLFNVYGPDETQPHVIPDILEQVAAGSTTLRLGRTDTYRDFVHVDDVVEGLLRTGTRLVRGSPVAECVNVGTGQETSVEELVQLIARLAGRTIHIVEEKTRIRRVDRQHLRADTRWLEKQLGWKPGISIRSGLQELLHESSLLATGAEP